MESDHSFNLQFPDNYDVWRLFLCSSPHRYLWWSVCSSSFAHQKIITLYHYYQVIKILNYILDISPLSYMYYWNFSQLVTCLFVISLRSRFCRKRDTDVQNRLLDSVGEGEDGMFWENSIETCILSRVKQITSPGWMHETSAQGWCTGKTLWDGMGWEVGGAIGMGNTCKSMADSCQCMAKTTTIL